MIIIVLTQIDDNYSIIGRINESRNIDINNGDYLLMYLKYDKYVEVPCVGFIIKYLDNGKLCEKVINPFMFYRNNESSGELIKVTYEQNSY